MWSTIVKTSSGLYNPPSLFQIALKKCRDTQIDIPDFLKVIPAVKSYMDKFNRLISLIFLCNTSHNNLLYGGYIRDLILNDQFPKDIDLLFLTYSDRRFFIDQLAKEKSLQFSITNISTKYGQLGLNYYKYIPQSPWTIEYSDSIITIKVELVENSDVSIMIDLTCAKTIKTDRLGRKVEKQNEIVTKFDFDVNLLIMQANYAANYPIGQAVQNNLTIFDRLSTRNVWPVIVDKEQIIENIRNKKFIVLDKLGYPNLTHPNTRSQQCVSKLSSNCIGRHTTQAYTLRKRIDKMINRGWTMLNLPCIHVDCILFPDDEYKKVQIIREMKWKLRMEEQRMAIEEENMRIKKTPPDPNMYRNHFFCSPQRDKSEKTLNFEKKMRSKKIYKQKRKLAKERAKSMKKSF